MRTSCILLIVLMAIILILDKVAEKLQDELISAQEEKIKKTSRPNRSAEETDRSVERSRR